MNQSIARRGALLHYKLCFTGPSNHKAQNHYLYPLNDYSMITVHYISRSFFLKEFFIYTKKCKSLIDLYLEV